jgi:4-alpha-glucanotransferase
MNVPGTAEGNWSWQAPAGAFDDVLAQRLRGLVKRFDRMPSLS